MMEINKNNYETFILDYYEGNLAKKQADELMLFLAENPKLKKEFDCFENITLSPDLTIKFEDKEKLKKNIITPCNNINKDNYENLFIADLEGDISSEESENLKTFIEKNPCLKKDYETFKLTYLKPDESIIFENKKSLKKYPFKAYFKKHVYSYVSIAASILIVFYFFFNKQEKIDFPARYEIAQINSKQSINNIKTENKIKEINISKKAYSINNENSILATANPSVKTDELEYRNNLKINNFNNINNVLIPLSDVAGYQDKIIFKRFEFIELLYFVDLHDEILLAEHKSRTTKEKIIHKSVCFLKKVINFKKQNINNDTKDKIFSNVAEYGTKSFNKIKKGDFRLLSNDK